MKIRLRVIININNMELLLRSSANRLALRWQADQSVINYNYLV